MSYAGTGALALGEMIDILDEQGTPRKADVNTSDYCGSKPGTQWMLGATGYFAGAADGDFNAATRASMMQAAARHGVLYNPLQPPSGEACSALIAEYKALEPAESVCPPGTIHVGQTCVPIPTPSGGGCPPGQMGVPPACFPVPSLPTQPGATPPPVAPPPGAPPAVPPPAPTLAQRWARLGTAPKVAVAVAAGAAVLLIAKAASGREPRRANSSALFMSREEQQLARQLAQAREMGLTKRDVKELYRRHPARYRALAQAFGIDAPRRRNRDTRPIRPRLQQRATLDCAAQQKIKNCHCSPPAKWRRKGATKKSDYAIPECFMYPLKFNGRYSRSNVASAARYIGVYGRTYPRAVTERAVAAIARAADAVGMGGEFSSAHQSGPQDVRKLARKIHSR